MVSGKVQRWATQDRSEVICVGEIGMKACVHDLVCSHIQVWGLALLSQGGVRLGWV